MPIIVSLPLAVPQAAPKVAAFRGAIPVRVERRGGRFVLLRNGKPYRPRGAGAHDNTLDALRAAGANSVRTWGGDDMEPFLDRCHRLGLSVLFGIWLNKKSEGMDYGDPAALDRQAEMVRTIVRRYKDHPAILGWGLGNEMELEDMRPELFRQIERLAKLTKAEDPNHPAITVLADMWPEKMALLKVHCPSLDALGINSYGGLPTLAGRMKEWDRPYLITEWAFGAPGSTGETPWKSPTEPTGTRKAELVRENLRGPLRDPKVVGDHFFHWSRSGADTSGWFSSFLKTGEKTPVVDAMTRAWGGRVGNRCPSVRKVEAPVFPELSPGQPLTVRLTLRDPENDPLSVSYEVLSDDPKVRFVGDFERPTAPAASGAGGTTITITAPSGPGPYRLVAIVRDGRGGADVATIPFRVR